MKKISEYAAMETEGILLNANESEQNISSHLIDRIMEEMRYVPFHRYPEDTSAELIKAYADYVQKKETQVIAGNGSDEMLGLLISLTMKEGKKLYTLSLDFSMYDYYVSMHNADMIKYEYGIQDSFDVEDFIRKGKEEKVDMILFSNPNNPTGRVLPAKTLCQIVEAFPDIYVVIDEAYADFADMTMLDYIDQYDNLLVTRTLSKAFALAGIRCGFLLGQEKTIAKIKPYKVPYNVNRLTQLVGRIVLEETHDTKAHIELVKAQRDALYQAYVSLEREDVILYPSQANYLYGVSTRKSDLINAFAKRGIVIRDYADDSFRITIGTKEQNEMIWEVLKTF